MALPAEDIIQLFFFIIYLKLTKIDNVDDIAFRRTLLTSKADRH